MVRQVVLTAVSFYVALAYAISGLVIGPAIARAAAGSIAGAGQRQV